MKSNFLLGNLRLTPGAQMELKRLPYDLIARHAINEHGNITRREREQNDTSMKAVGPIISRYRANPLDPKSKNITIRTNEMWCETLIEVE